MKFLNLTFISFFILVCQSYAGEYTCPKANIFSNILDNVPFEESIPLYVAGGYIGSGKHNLPSNASHKYFCNCKDNDGIVNSGLVLGMWEIAYLIEFTRVPNCSLVLGGISLPIKNTRVGTSGNNENDSSDLMFYHAHLYSFPLYSMLNMFSEIRCGQYDYMDLDLLYASELDPSWNDELVSLKEHPETLSLANKNIVSSCAYDVKNSMQGEINNDLFYCAGSWGFLYPLSGYVGNTGSIAENTSLLAVRLLTKLHRRNLLANTMGNDNLCGNNSSMMMDKELYRFSMLYPTPEKSSAHALGSPVSYWQGDSRVPPGMHDAIYVVWRYRNCCLGAF
ncbi:MAG: TraU family protein [Succinivibrionaceae bacterium]